MNVAFPLHRFEEFGRLTSSEISAVSNLAKPAREYPRHGIIRREGESASEFYLLADGWVASSVTMPDGGRQIMKVHLPGDALGTPSMSTDNAVETLVALTPVVVAAVTFESFGRLIAEHPRIATLFLLSVQRERVALMDWLSSIGRTKAEARLAALLIDLFRRLEQVGAVQDQSFKLLLTQEQIGDAIGMTAVHANRMFKELEADGLIARDHQQLTICNYEGLKRLAALPVRKLRTHLDWLPTAR